jgi:DNA polymerase-3 subunit beta
LRSPRTSPGRKSAATDGYRLAERVVPLVAGRNSDIAEPLPVIVPARTVAEVVRILGVFKEALDSQENIEIAVGESQVIFSYDNVEITSRVIEGRYPDYRPLIPEKFETKTVISREELQRAVKTTSLFSRTGLNDIHFKFEPPSSIKVNAVNSQTGEHAVDLVGEVTGKPNTVMVNFKYFLDGVNNCDGEDIAINLVNATSPCILRPIPPEGQNPNYLYIVMPIRQ